jgi:hypothetical protein
VTIGRAGVGKQVTNGCVTMAYAMLVGIGLVYPIVVILVYLLLVPLVTFVALPLVVIGCFVSLASRCTLPLRWLLSEDDRQIHPEAQRWMAERM